MLWKLQGCRAYTWKELCAVQNVEWRCDDDDDDDDDNDDDDDVDNTSHAI